MDRRPGRLSTVLVGGLCVLAGFGCTELLMVTGPKTGDARSMVSITDVVTGDHRTKEMIRFAVLGDVGTGREGQAAVGRAVFAACRDRGSCDFVLMTGDNIYETPVGPLDDDESPALSELYRRSFEDPYREFGRTDFWLVAGNHDWYRHGLPASEIRRTAHSERWRMPALDYAVPQLPEWIAVYAIETTLLTEGLDTGQIERARAHLCRATGWRILFGHHPVYTAGRRHGGANGTLETIRENLVDPLIRPCQVDLYLAGHDHLQAHLRTPDFHQIIQGAGGADLYRVRKGWRFPEEDKVTVMNARSSLGFAIMEVRPDRLSVRFFALVDGGVELFYEQTLTRVPGSP